MIKLDSPREISPNRGKKIVLPILKTCSNCSPSSKNTAASIASVNCEEMKNNRDDFSSFLKLGKAKRFIKEKLLNMKKSEKKDDLLKTEGIFKS